MRGPAMQFIRGKFRATSKLDRTPSHPSNIAHLASTRVPGASSGLGGHMRLTTLGVVFAAACALSAPAWAQAPSRNQNWFANAAVGPSFGTLGSTPVVDATGGYKLTSVFSVGGELGMLPHAPFGDASVIAPAVPLVA